MRPGRPLLPRKAIRGSQRSLTRLTRPPASSSPDCTTGIQYRRRNAPIAVSGPVLVSSSFSSLISIVGTLLAAEYHAARAPDSPGCRPAGLRYTSPRRETPTHWEDRTLALTATVYHVDLTRGTVETKILPEDVYRKYPGGSALAAYLLLQSIPKGAD